MPGTLGPFRVRLVVCDPAIRMSHPLVSSIACDDFYRGHMTRPGSMPE